MVEAVPDLLIKGELLDERVISVVTEDDPDILAEPVELADTDGEGAGDAE